MYNKLCRAAAVVTLLCMITAALFGCSLKPEADPSEEGSSAVTANADPYTIETWGGNQSNETGDNNAVGSVPQTASAERTKATEKTQVRVTIPEGYSFMQIANLLESKGVCTAKDFYDVCQSYSPKSFSIPSSSDRCFKMEGYLFPDTYEFFVDEDPTHALSRLLDNFNTKMSDELMQKVEASGYSLNQILTIASLIEKETDGTDRENIASVIYNRLNNIGETYHKLQIDASLIYGLGDNYTGTLTSSDLNYNTPYNLSMYEGLPPTPIANPGLASIQAALEPAQTNYYFYALGKDGVHHFFKTYAEHSSFVSSSQYAG